MSQITLQVERDATICVDLEVDDDVSVVLVAGRSGEVIAEVFGPHTVHPGEHNRLKFIRPRVAEPASGAESVSSTEDWLAGFRSSMGLSSLITSGQQSARSNEILVRAPYDATVHVVRGHRLVGSAQPTRDERRVGDGTHFSGRRPGRSAPQDPITVDGPPLWAHSWNGPSFDFLPTRDVSREQALAAIEQVAELPKGRPTPGAGLTMSVASAAFHFAAFGAYDHLQTGNPGSGSNRDMTSKAIAFLDELSRIEPSEALRLANSFSEDRLNAVADVLAAVPAILESLPGGQDWANEFRELLGPVATLTPDSGTSRGDDWGHIQ